MRSGVAHRWPWIAVLAASVSSCELAVPQASLDDVRCSQEGQAGPPACPDGKTCVSGRCVAGASGLDAGEDADASINPVDSAGGSGGTGGSGGSGGSGHGGGGAGGAATGGAAGTDASVGGSGATGGTAGEAGTGGGPDASEEPAPKLPLGSPCTVPSDCLSGTCLPVPNGGGAMVCSQFCCNSYSCPAGTVCSPFFGSNLCADPTSVGALVPGATVGAAGAQCSDGTQCRSGRCGTDGKCKDVCCGNDSCPGNAACESTAQFGQVGWYCADYAAGTRTGNQSSCGSDTDCDSNLCHSYAAFSTCSGPCCGDGDCGFGGFCDYFWDGSSAVRQCMTLPLFKTGNGAACCSDADCGAGQHCVPQLSSALALIGTHDNVWVSRCQ